MNTGLTSSVRGRHEITFAKPKTIRPAAFRTEVT